MPLLLSAVCGHDVAVLVDTAGRRNPLVAAWRRDALQRALARTGDPAGVPARRLLEEVDAVPLPDADGWGADCDSWEDLRAARARWGAGGATP